MPLVWEMPDRSVQITTLTATWLEQNRLAGETTDAAVLRLAVVIQAKAPSLAGAVPTLVKTADVPTDRAQRHKWRLRGGTVMVDATVPDRVDPKAAMRSRVSAARSLDDLKGVVTDLIDGA